MAKFIALGYGDEKGDEQTDPALRAVAHAHDARLKADGAFIGVAGPPVQVCNHSNTGVQTVKGSFLHSDLPLVGFT